MEYWLGISAFYHDSAAVLLGDGRILAAAQEERFSRRKNDERFPSNAIRFCLDYARITPAHLEAVVFYEKPIIKFSRMLETFLAVAPGGLRSFPQILPPWLSEKLNIRGTIQRGISGLKPDCPLYFTTHHQAHAGSAFLPSPFRSAAILTVDGAGEWASTVMARGCEDDLELMEEIRFPHSLGLLYSAFTAYCGFRVNSGEYKLMGLAPYGRPRYAGKIRDHLIDLREDGSFWLNMDYFSFLTRWSMTNERFHRLFDGPPRTPDTPLDQRHMDVARSIQEVTEEAMLRLARRAKSVTGEAALCLAGGVALNCVANGRILRERIFDKLWIQPAAGDAGGALGAVLTVWHQQRRPRTQPASPPSASGPARDAMQGAFLGPEYSDAAIKTALDAHGAVFTRLSDAALLDTAAELLAREKVVGWFQGRSEFGPRALGNRSILGDPRSPRMQSLMNLKVKFRESFRPFAPAVLEERCPDYFELEVASPYMLLVAPVRESLLLPRHASPAQGLDQLKEIRSSIPAVTHIDNSARIQTVSSASNPRFYALLKKFEALTGCGVLINTSFNVRGEPVVGSPDDAYRCFVNTAMDCLVIGNYLLHRADQPHRTPPQTFVSVPD